MNNLWILKAHPKSQIIFAADLPVFKLYSAGCSGFRRNSVYPGSSECLLSVFRPDYRDHGEVFWAWAFVKGIFCSQIIHKIISTRHLTWLITSDITESSRGKWKKFILINTIYIFTNANLQTAHAALICSWLRRYKLCCYRDFITEISLMTFSITSST